jgi:hypothetical protein
VQGVSGVWEFLVSAGANQANWIRFFDRSGIEMGRRGFPLAARELET